MITSISPYDIRWLAVYNIIKGNLLNDHLYQSIWYTMTSRLQYYKG